MKQEVRRSILIRTSAISCDLSAISFRDVAVDFFDDFDAPDVITSSALECFSNGGLAPGLPVFFSI